MDGDGWDAGGLCVTDCTRCPELVESRSQVVNGVGPDDADLLLVGEAPGATEDEQGEPFVGRSGDVLAEGLRDVGLGRGDVRITNCVRCRPPENRDPTAEERGNCRNYLDREILAVDPALIVTLGKVPAQHLLERSVPVTSEAGEIHEAAIGSTRRPVLVCVHPAATLYDRSQRGTFEAALRVAADHTGGGGQSTLTEF